MMVTPATEGLGNASFHGGKPSYRRFSTADADAARRAEEDEVLTCVVAFGPSFDRLPCLSKCSPFKPKHLLKPRWQAILSPSSSNVAILQLHRACSPVLSNGYRYGYTDSSCKVL